MKRLSLLVAAFAALLLGGVTAFSTIGDAAAADTTVNMQNIAFSPANITINVGDTVTWTNNDQVPHTATSDPGVSPAFDTGMLQPGQSGSVTFNTAGTFTYFCQVHPNMHGTITVQAASTGGGATATATSTSATGGTGGSSPQAPSAGTGTSYGTDGGYGAAWFIGGAVALLAVAGGAVFLVERNRRS